MGGIFLFFLGGGVGCAAAIFIARTYLKIQIQKKKRKAYSIIGRFKINYPY